jgi:hypothetical protein
MRYLAELVWAPHAILHNQFLGWRAIDATTVEVSAPSLGGPVRVRLVFENGLAVGFEADDRPRLDGGRAIPTRWQGRCFDYRTIGGCRDPAQAVAGWVLPEGRFDYWRGTITEVTLA